MNQQQWSLHLFSRPPPQSANEYPPLPIASSDPAIPPSVAALFAGSPVASHPPKSTPFVLPASPAMTILNNNTTNNQPTTPKSTRFPGVASMPLLGEDRPLVPFYATPPRIGPQYLLRRQQSSSAAVCTGPGAQKGRYPAGLLGKNGRYTTPPPMRYGCGMVVTKGSELPGWFGGVPCLALTCFLSGDDENVPSLHFAASKFSDSPSAKSLPPPPSQWMDEIESRLTTKKMLAGEEKTGLKQKKTGMDGIEEEETTSDDTGVVFDLEDASPTGSFDNENNTTLSAPNSATAGVRVDPLKLIAAATNY